MKKMRLFGKITAFTLMAVTMLSLASCGIFGRYEQKKQLEQVRTQNAQASLKLAREKELARDSVGTYHYVNTPARDTENVINIDGHDLKVMNAVRDEKTGEMVANDEIVAAHIEARFRNVAERHGMIDIEFQVVVPKEMYNPDWQLRFYPDMYILEDSTRLESVIVTGAGYRGKQLRGYEQYRRFLESIITDSTMFVKLGLLETFLERNIPQVYRFKSDTNFVTDEMFYSEYGVSEQEAVEHYTRQWAKRANQRKIDSKDDVRRRLIKAPIITEGVRLDTVITNMNGDFVYTYVQSVKTRPRLRKIDVVLSGEIFQQENLLYNMERSEPLTFYVSSVSTLAETKERYIREVVSRRVGANVKADIVFKVGRYDVDPLLADNEVEIDRVKSILGQLSQDEVFDLDSIVVRSSCSPEGTWQANERLSINRGAAISKYFVDYQKAVIDSVKRNGGMMLGLGGEAASKQNLRVVPFVMRSLPEDWDGLTEAVLRDEVMEGKDKDDFMATVQGVNRDADERELAKKPYYSYLKNEIYPKLRHTYFEFNLHRKGFEQDTVVTDRLDTLYMRGVQALRDRDYDEAVVILRGYHDYNSAIAFVSKDMNASALDVLKDLEETPQVLYMMALVQSRLGDERKAVDCYVKACEMDGTFVHRGNLDPEIYYLIKKYGLNKQDDVDLLNL